MSGFIKINLLEKQLLSSLCFYKKLSTVYIRTFDDSHLQIQDDFGLIYFYQLRNMRVYNLQVI